MMKIAAIVACLFVGSFAQTYIYEYAYTSTDSTCSTPVVAERAILSGNGTCYGGTAAYQTCYNNGTNTTLSSYACADNTFYGSATLPSGACLSPTSIVPDGLVYSQIYCEDSTRTSTFAPKINVYSSTSCAGSAAYVYSVKLNTCFREEARDSYTYVRFNQSISQLVITSNCTDNTCTSCNITLPVGVNNGCQQNFGLNAGLGFPLSSYYSATVATTTTGVQTTGVQTTGRSTGAANGMFQVSAMFVAVAALIAALL